MGEEGEKSARKIRVEFEMNPEDVKALIETGEREPKRVVSDDELAIMGEEGVIKASDYLSEAQIDEISLSAPKYIRKTGSKVKSAISNPSVQQRVVEKAVDRIFVQSVEEDLEERPKE
jgi:hypothetical protein